MAKMTERGKIRNRAYAKQLRDFSGLRWGTITPTDIDGFFEMGNRIFIFIEIKHGDSEMLRGQKLALERLVDVVSEAKEAILIIGRHDCTSEVDVDVALCSVTMYRMRKKWRIPKEVMTIREIIDSFLTWINKGDNQGAIRA